MKPPSTLHTILRALQLGMGTAGAGLALFFAVIEGAAPKLRWSPEV